MNNTLVTVLVILVIVIIGWLAYSQGYFKGADEEQNDGLEINIGGSTEG
ncbi:hypothetical protein GW943_01995 [Candidatus Parcubacteria bacterium]|nr:hypothetical protein [Candidatus Parcubacteria bacterium]